MNGAMVLAAAAGRRERRGLLAAAALFVLIAMALAWVPKRIPDLGEMQLALFAFPTLFLWMGWFSRLLLLSAQARALRVPRMAAYVGSTLVAVAVLTTAVPAFAVSLSGLPLAFALGVLGCVAACGLLMALVPRGLAGLLGLLPMAFSAIPDEYAAAVDWTAAAPLLAIALALLAAWRWLRIERRMDDWEETSWQQPLVFAMARRGGFLGGADLLDPRAQAATLPRWLRKMDDVGALRPGQVRTLRALMGGIFAPVGWRQRLVLGGFYLVVLALFWHQSARTGETPWEMLLMVGLMTGGIVLLGPFALRLQALQQDHGGEMAELAILPGWGDPAEARRRLLGTIARVYANWCVVVLAIMAWGAWMTGHAGALALALLSTLALAVLGAAFWLRPLAGRRWRPSFWYAVPAVLLGTPLLGGTIVAFDRGTLVAPMLLAWGAVLAWGTWLGLRAWRGVQARPQPFLMY